MKTQIIDFKQVGRVPKKSVLSLGCFDGIHLGHQSLIKKLVLEAKKRKAPSCLCLFDPLPLQTLKGKHFKRLFTIEETKELLEAFSLDFLGIIPFNHRFSKLSPSEFVHSFIVQQFDPVKMVVGYDFSFAHQRKGKFSTLKKLANQHGFLVEQIGACLYKEEPISSSRIRKHLSLAQMEELKALLGRPFSIKAKVIRGSARGKKLGFPTANLQVKQKELPPFGVYAGKAKISGSWHKAVINIGRRPTFSGDNGPVLIEVHIISARFDLYAQDLEVQLDFFIRREKTFSNALELKSAIQQDIKRAESFKYTGSV